MKNLFVLVILFGISAQALTEKENLRVPAKPWMEIKKEGYKSLGCNLEVHQFTGWDPVTNKSSGREIEMFLPENPGKFRPVILLPPTGGTNIFDRKMARYFCDRNVPFYILSKFDGYEDKDFDLTRHDRQMRGDIAALKELILWIGQPVNLMGASLGALYGAAAAGADPQIKNVVLTVGGIDLPGILTNSELDSVTVHKINRKKIYHLASDQDYLQLMKKSIYYDPRIFLDEEKKSERFLLFISKDDQGVPTKYQDQLAEKLPRAEKVYFNTGHVTTIGRTYIFNREKIYNFLNKD